MATKQLSMGSQFLNEICDQMGLSQNVTGMKICIPLDGVVTAEVEEYVNVEDAEKISAVLKRYELREIEE